MNWQQMSKEQKNKLILAVLGGGFVLAALYQFALTPFLNSHQEMMQKRDDLRDNVNKAQMAIHSEVTLDRQARELRSKLTGIFSTQIPPPDNALSWASQIINGQAGKLGLDVISTVEVEAGGGGWDQSDMAKRAFKPYAVQVDISCSFDKAEKLVRSLQQSNPFLFIASLSISADPRSVETPAVVMVIEWPSWHDPKNGQHPFDDGNKDVKKGKEARRSA
jgi:hypothetical protein